MISNKVPEDTSKIPKEVIKDGAKWMLMPSKIVLDSLSLWPERQNFVTRILHQLMFISYFFIIMGQFYNLKFNKLELGAIAFTLSLFMVTVESVVRRVIVYFYYKKFTKIIHTVYYQFWSSKITGMGLHKELNKSTWALMIYCGAYTFTAFVCASQFILLPYASREFPLCSELPYFKENPFYDMVYTWQSFLSLDLAFCVCGMDILFVCLINNCVAQFKLLKEFLVQSFESYTKNDDAKGAEDVLRRFMDHHKLLLTTCKEINEMFSYYILVQFLTSMGTVCVSAFVATSAMRQQFGTSVTYLMGHLCEILIYCYMGNELIYWSSELSTALFECGWHLVPVDIKLKKSLVIIMIRTQKPVRIPAGGFGFLSMASFVNLIKFSFSVYTLLDSLMKKGH